MNFEISTQTVCLGLMVLIVLRILMSLVAKERRYHKKTPPVISIPECELLRRPREVYERALAESGPIIAVKRKGRLEYIVDARLTHEVLTSNSSFSFEQGTAFILNLHYFNKLFTSFFLEIDDLVRNVIVSRMPLVVERVFPAFVKHANNLMHKLETDLAESGKLRYVDALDLTHRSISEAMALIILGPCFVSESNLEVIERVAHDMAVVTGIYQNTSWWGTTFPNLWRMFTWTRILCTTIPKFYRTIGLQIWRNLGSEKRNPEEAIENPDAYKGSVLDYLACKNSSTMSGTVSLRAYFRITILVLGIIFASVHQTASVAVWILYELAIRPEYLPGLREELFNVAGADWTSEHAEITYESLQNAIRLDSFIREVMRTKGDTLSTCRLTTCDVPIAGYTLPRGFLVSPLATLSHMNKNYHGPNAEVFDGNRWLGTGKRAVTVSDTYFPFGLGRWACPGRALAVAEIKMIVWAVIYGSRPVLRGDRYSIDDPLNVTSVSPKGEMTLIPH